MTRLKVGLGLATATIAIVAGPPAAAAQYYVPPGNSAATQYTEAFPAAGGNRNAEDGESRERSPARVLGERNARRLEARGPEGRSAAALAAATAPPEEAANGDRFESLPSEAGGPDARQRGEPADGSEREPGAGGSAPPRGGGPGGSSGLAEVLGQALGAPPGGAGALLPLTMLATIAWSAAYLWRRQDRRA